MVQTVLDQANHAVDKEHLANAVEDLASRVDDWKALKVEVFGELLRFGTFTVLKGDGGRDTEREVRTSLTDYTAELRPASHRRLSFPREPMKIRMCLSHIPPLAPDQTPQNMLSGLCLPFGTTSLDLSPHWSESTALTWRPKFLAASMKRLSLPTFDKFSLPLLSPSSSSRRHDPFTLQSNISMECVSYLPDGIICDALQSPCTSPSPDSRSHKSES